MTEQQFDKLLKRLIELGNLPMESLRAEMNFATDSRAELIRLTREEGLKRGDLISDIIDDEFREFINSE